MDSAALAQASTTLWLATLSLMTAYMKTRAPAHRYLLARRIARNFQTLGQQECFSGDCRRRFLKLGMRWEDTASELDPQPREPEGWVERAKRMLRRLA